MPNTAIWATGNDAGPATTAATTQFENLTGTVTITATEADAQITSRNAGTFSHMYVRLTANNNSLSTTFTFRKNSGSVNQTLSVATLITGDFEDPSHTDTTVAGDLVNITSIPGAGTGTVTITVTSVLFTATNIVNTVTRNTNFMGSATYTTANTFFNVFGNTSAVTDTTEAICKARQRKAGTYQNMHVKFSANSNSAAVTYTSRKNGGNGNLTLSIAASGTGIVEDTSHSDTVVPGDDYCVQFVTSGTVSFIPRQCSVEFISLGVFSQLTCGESIGIAVAANTVPWYSLSGRLRALVALESNLQMKTRIQFAFSELTVVVSTNAATADSTLVFRKNSTNGNMTVPITHGVTGAFSDSNNIDIVLGTDELNHQITCPLNGAITIGSISVWATAYAGQNFSMTQSPVSNYGWNRDLMSQAQSPVFG